MTTSIFLPHALKSLRVLVVDDDAFVLDFVEDMLHVLGIQQVGRSTNGRDGLRAIEGTEAPDFIICDLNMPGMDGIEFLRHLADQGFEGGVVLSSGADKRIVKTVESLVRAHGLRFLGTVEKPIKESALVAAIMKLGGPEPGGRPLTSVQALTPEEIRAGLEAGCVDVFFQPKVSVVDRRVVGAESLVRWRHPERGLVLPGAFIAVAEQHGLIDELTLAMFRKAMHYLGQWVREGHNLKVAVNLSMDSLGSLELPETLLNIARQAGADPCQVVLEITESRLMTNITKSFETITRLRLMGFNLSIDDFGTGYSSMEKLQQLPFNELKVDRAFIHGAANDAAARAILESSARLSQALDMTIVAEGVETQQDWDLVSEHGYDQVQGYFVAKPMPADLFIPWKISWESAGSNLVQQKSSCIEG